MGSATRAPSSHPALRAVALVAALGIHLETVLAHQPESCPLLTQLWAAACPKKTKTLPFSLCVLEKFQTYRTAGLQPLLWTIPLVDAQMQHPLQAPLVMPTAKARMSSPLQEDRS